MRWKKKSFIETHVKLLALKSISENFSRERNLDKQPSRFEVFEVLNEGEHE